MATLIRVKPASANSSVAHLESSIPAPFPAELLREQQQRDDILEDLETENLDILQGPTSLQHLNDYTADREETLQKTPNESEGTLEPPSRELLPSIAYVQQSCLMTLNNLFLELPGSKDEWQPILPPRRHSMPSLPAAESSVDASTASSSSALHTLVSNLRNYDAGEMTETSTSTDDAALITELQRRVDSMSFSLSPSDTCLARALTSLLAHIHRLSFIDPKTFGPRVDDVSTNQADRIDHEHTGDLYADLKRQLSDLQVRRSDSDGNLAGRISSPVLTVEIALLWTKIDEELETVLALCRQRTEAASNLWNPDHAPPEYDYTEHDTHLLPEYEHEMKADYQESAQKVQGSVTSFAQLAPAGVSEKMKLDLDAVAMAIDRLYLVAPQLHNQRVELKKGKLEELERARLAGPSTSKAKLVRDGKAKEKEKDVKELEKIVDLIGKAKSRRIDEQSATFEVNVHKRLEKVRQRDNDKRDAFVEQLIRHSGAGRLHSQDAVLQTGGSKVRNPDALLTLPDFLREQVPDHLRVPDPETMLTLPEFVKEPPPEPAEKPSPPTISRFSKKFGKSRSRSLSAPPLAWLIPSRSKSSSSPQVDKEACSSTSKGTTLTVRYVAEHHENLQHVLVFMGVEGMPAGVDLEAEVPAGTGETSAGDKLLLRCGSSTSPPLCLPVGVVPGKKEVRVQSGHYEVKIATYSDPSSQSPYPAEPPALLDATQIFNLSPTTFICASCSLPLVQSTKIAQYVDLPSEYWSELLDAWMCHNDQKLHSDVTRHGQGFWPRADQALVGGSYILFDEASVVRSNMRGQESTKGEEWERVGCICGAIVGRCQRHVTSRDATSIVYRLAKYAIRPVSPTAEPCRLPFSAFILEDMIELVHAHASHRFLILDEQEERPRLLVWLFKPSIRLSYATTAQYALPKSGSIHAAKVLFKILGPESSTTDVKSILDKHPGFPQAERLLYPMDICMRLAALLKESNTSYPIGMRVMTGLLVGWLHRS